MKKIALVVETVRVLGKYQKKKWKTPSHNIQTGSKQKRTAKTSPQTSITRNPKECF